MMNFFQRLKTFFSRVDSVVVSDGYFSRRAKIIFLWFIAILSLLYTANYFYLKLNENSYSNITELVNNKEYTLAHSKLQKLLDKNPNDPYFLILSARVAMGISENASSDEMRRFYLSKSLEYLERAENANPDLVEIYRTRGLAYLQLGEFALASHSYRKALTMEDSSIGWADLGHLQLIQGDITSAVESFNRALRLKSDNELATVGIIKILVLQNQTDRALNTALSLYAKTSNPNTRIQLAGIIGNAYFKLTKYDQAKKYFNDGLALDSTSIEFHYGLAEIAFYSLFNIKDPKNSTSEARVLAEKVIEMDPSYPYGYALMTRIAESTDNKEEYDKYLALTKNSVALYPFMNKSEKDTFIKTLPLFNTSSGNVTIRVISTKSSSVKPNSTGNTLESK